MIGFAQSDSKRPGEAKTLPTSIPLFPLQDVMLFPGVARPLHIFEPRYREMLLDALASDRIIGMVMLQPDHEEDYFGRPPIYPVGCAGYIAQVDGLPDGRYNIVLEGVTKFRVQQESTRLGFRVAEVEAITETLSESESEALRRHRPRLLELLTTITRNREPPTSEELSDTSLVNLLAQALEMKPEQRLDLLKRPDPLERAEALLELFPKDTHL